jgi:capsular polysaccharide biosynthesis protein
LVGANSNVADRVIVNQVSVRAANSAGLIEVATSGGGGATAAEIWNYINRTLTQNPPTATEVADAVWSKTLP